MVAAGRRGGFGARAPAQRPSRRCSLHWRLASGAEAEIPAEYPERAAYVAAGSIEVDGRRFSAGHMLVFVPGKPVVFTAPEPAVVMLLGGEPVGKRFIEWNFVSSSQERIEQAKSRLAGGADEAAAAG